VVETAESSTSLVVCSLWSVVVVVVVDDLLLSSSESSEERLLSPIVGDGVCSIPSVNIDDMIQWARWDGIQQQWQDLVVVGMY
jgi:hypothetical protein